MTRSTKPKAKKTAARSRTKTEQMVGLLGRAVGASIPEMMKVTGWQAHSVRGFMAGTLKKKGHVVESVVDEGGARRYRLAAVAS